MAFSTILYITASLALSPLVSARGRGGGGGGGTTGPWCSEDIKIGDGYCLPKFYVIVPSSMSTPLALCTLLTNIL